MKLKTWQPLSIAFLTMVSTQSTWAHDTGRVGVESDVIAPVHAGHVVIKIQMADMERRLPVTDRDLEVVHEKKLHAFIFDQALKEFHHVHPVYVGNNWVVEADLPVNGHYSLWAQGTLTDQMAEFTADTEFDIAGGTQANPTAIFPGETRRASAGIYQASLSNTVIYAGQMAMLDLTLSHTDGTPVEIHPGLGAQAHVIAVSWDGEQLGHLHAIETATSGQLMLHAELREPGGYRFWVQYQDGSEVRTVPLTLTVLPQPSSP